MIKTIIFDLSEVYLHGLLGTHEALSERIGRKIESSDLHVPEMYQFFEGRITEEDYWKAILLKHGWDIDIGGLKEIVRGNFTEIEGTRAVIEKLKKNEYQLGLLSVHAKEWIEYCEKKFDYHKLFDSILYSFEVAICKPDKKAYELILQKLKSQPSGCLFVDDAQQNLTSASELGMQTILFRSSSDLLKELGRLGINIK